MNSLPIENKKEGKIQTSVELTKACSLILKQNPALIWLSTLETLVSLPLIIIYLTFYFVATKTSVWSKEEVLSFMLGWRFWLAIFLFYWTGFFASTFFNVGLIAETSKALRGEPVSWREGIRFAWGKLPIIFQWSALFAFVLVFLRILEKRIPKAGWIVGRILGATWAVASMLAVPILVHESIGPIEALKRSSQFLKRTWGENIVGPIALWFVRMELPPAISRVLIKIVLIIIMLTLSVILIAQPSGENILFIALAGIVVSLVIYVTVLSCVGFTLPGIFQAVLYSYAVEGVVPAGFDKNLLQQAWRVK